MVTAAPTWLAGYMQAGARGCNIKTSKVDKEVEHLGSGISEAVYNTN